MGGSRGGVRGVGGGLTLPFRHNGMSCEPNEPSHGLQTTLQGKVGHLVIIVDDLEQLHTNATLLKPTKHCHGLFRALQGHEKPFEKVDLAMYGYSAVVSR